MLFRCDQERACERIADLDDPVFAVLYGVGLWFCIVVDDRDILLKGWLTCAVGVLLILFIFYSPDQLRLLIRKGHLSYHSITYRPICPSALFILLLH